MKGSTDFLLVRQNKFFLSYDRLHHLVVWFNKAQPSVLHLVGTIENLADPPAPRDILFTS